MLAYALDIVIKGVITRPEDNADALCLGVVENSLQIYLRNNIEQVVLILCSPTLVEDDILHTILCCKVDIRLICSGIYARLEIHIGKTPMVPPLPSNLARCNPRGILYA